MNCNLQYAVCSDHCFHYNWFSYRFYRIIALFASHRQNETEAESIPVPIYNKGNVSSMFCHLILMSLDFEVTFCKKLYT